MPVETRKVGGKLRTVEVSTGKLARNKAGTPLDGGGWANSKTGRGKAERQSGYINDAWHRKHGGISR